MSSLGLRIQQITKFSVEMNANINFFLNLYWLEQKSQYTHIWVGILALADSDFNICWMSNRKSVLWPLYAFSCLTGKMRKMCHIMRLFEWWNEMFIAIA